MKRCPRSVVALAALVLAFIAYSPAASGAAAQEEWSIRSFDATYVIEESGTFSVTEDINVDFGRLERHGIFRHIPLDSNRLIDVTDISVTDGLASVPFETGVAGLNIVIRIGDSGVLVSGQQRYLISYRVDNGLNQVSGRDELYWNITGNEWEVTIEAASASVTTPARVIERVSCFQGPTGSTDPCESSFRETSASFQTTGAQPPGSGLTVVVSLTEGVGSLETPDEVEDGVRNNGGDSGGGVSAVLLLGVVAGVALAGASIAVVAMILIRRRFLRY